MKTKEEIYDLIETRINDMLDDIMYDLQERDMVDTTAIANFAMIGTLRNGHINLKLKDK